MALCLATDCSRDSFARGLCGTHYKRFMKGQDINEHEKLQHSMVRGGLEKLGLHKHHPFYLAWVNMKTRCDNPKSTQWKWYGGRGVGYDIRWSSFMEFYKDLWELWEPGLSLERGDNDEGYCKLNCSWIPLAEQAKHRRPRNAS